MKNIFLFLGLLIFSSTQAQNFWRIVLDQGEVQAFAVNAQEDIYVAVIDFYANPDALSKIYKSTNKGETWTKLSLQFTGGFGDTAITSIATNMAGHLFAGTNNSGIFKSTDDGTTWTNLDTSVISLSSIELITRNGNDLYVNGGNKLFKSTDGGTSWNQIYSGATGSLDFDGSDIFMATGGTMKISRDNGATWSDYYVAQNGFTCIDITSNAIYTGVHNLNSYGYLAKSTDDGATWTQFTTAMNIRPSDIFVNDNTGHIYIAAFDGADGTIYFSSDDGVTYTEKRSGLFWEKCTEFLPLSDGYLLLANGAGGVAKSTISTNNVVIPTGIELLDAKEYALTVTEQGAKVQITFEMPEVAEADVTILNMEGKVVYNAAQNKFDAGQHTFTVSKQTLSGGMYLCKLTVQGKQLVRKFSVQ